jgi:hypothetical protein
MRTIVLREAQVEALRMPSSEGFVGRVEAHLRRFFPGECARLGGKPALRAVVDHGMARAAHHGLRSEREVCKYLDLMFAFGRDFDRDPRLPWAVAIFEGHTHDLSRSKIDRLFEQALAHPEHATGLAGPPEAR